MLLSFFVAILAFGTCILLWEMKDLKNATKANSSQISFLSWLKATAMEYILQSALGD